MYETILSPLNYGGLSLKNRIIFAPTSLGLSRPSRSNACAGSPPAAAP